VFTTKDIMEQLRVDLVNAESLDEIFRAHKLAIQKFSEFGLEMDKIIYAYRLESLEQLDEDLELLRQYKETEADPSDISTYKESHDTLEEIRELL